MSKFRFLFPLLVVFALIAGACGSDSDDDASGNVISADADGSGDDEGTASDDDGDMDMSGDADSDDEPATTDDVSDSTVAEDEDVDDEVDEDVDDDVADDDVADVDPADNAKLETALGDFGDATDAERVCVLRALADSDLLSEAVNDVDIDDLSTEQQIDAVDLVVNCAPRLMAEDLASDDTMGEFVDAGEFEACLVEVHAEEGRDLSEGLRSISAEEVGSDAAQAAVVNLFGECISGDAMASFIASAAGGDPSMAEAVDEDCIQSAFAADGALDPLWRALVSDPGSEFEDLPPEVTDAFLEPFFGCVSWGRLMSSSAAEDGVVLSEDSIACIDQALAEEDLLALFNDSSPEADAKANEVLGSATLRCLSDEELAAMSG